MKSIKQTILGSALLALAGFIFLSSAGATPASAQTKSDDSVKEALMALENQAFEAVKNKDTKFFENYLAEDFHMIGPAAMTKAEVVKRWVEIPCAVNSVSLNNFRLTMLSKEVALMTYKNDSEFVCKGNKMLANSWDTAVFVKRGEKWLKVFYVPHADNHNK